MLIINHFLRYCLPQALLLSDDFPFRENTKKMYFLQENSDCLLYWLHDRDRYPVILVVRLVEFAVDEGSEIPDHLLGGERCQQSRVGGPINDRGRQEGMFYSTK